MTQVNNNITGLLWKLEKNKTLFEQVNLAMQRYEERTHTHTPAKYIVMRGLPDEQLSLLGVEVVLSDRIPVGGYFIITGALKWR